MRRGRVARVKRRLMQRCGGGGPPCFLRIRPTSLLCYRGWDCAGVCVVEWS